MTIQGVVDWFIHPRIKEDTGNYLRARQLILFVFIAIGFFLINLLKWIFLEQTNLAFSIGSVWFFVMLMCFIFRYSGSIAIVGNGIVAALSFHFVFIAWHTGGLESASISWIVIIPVFASIYFTTLVD